MKTIKCKNDDDDDLKTTDVSLIMWVRDVMINADQWVLSRQQFETTVIRWCLMSLILEIELF